MENKRYAIPLEWINSNPWQARHVQTDPVQIAELAEDIKTNGLLQIPLGRIIFNDAPVPIDKIPLYPGNPVEKQIVQIAFGHNRLTAFKLLAEEDEKYTSMPVDLAYLSDEEMADYAWAENERRQDVTPLDRALTIQKWMEDFGWKQEQVAERIHKDRSTVAHALRLLKLPEDVRKLLGSGKLSERQAIALLPLFDLPEQIRATAEANYYSDGKPSSIIKSAMAGASSDAIRQWIDELVLRNGSDLHEAIWPLDAKEIFLPHREQLAADSCKGCPQRQDLAHRSVCSNNVCYRLKESIWKKDKLEKASQASGIPILEEDVDRNYISDFGYDRHVVPILRKTGCQNLRLAYGHKYSDHDKEKRLGDLGFPEIEVVCKKRQGYCTCLTGLHAKNEQDAKRWMETSHTPTPAEETSFQDAKKWSQTSPDAAYLGELDKDELVESPASAPVVETPAGPTAEELKMLADKQRAEEREAKKHINEMRTEEREAKKHINEMRTKVVGRVQRALEANKIEAWLMIYQKINMGVPASKTKEWDLAKIKQAIASKLIDEPWSGEKAKYYIDRINQVLKNAGMGKLDDPEKTLMEVFSEQDELPASL